MSDDVNDLVKQAAIRDAQKRTTTARHEVPEQLARRDAPTPGAVAGGAPLTLDVRGPRALYVLGGREVVAGDVIELYTNRLVGWVRGRFAWTGRPYDRPRLVLSVWDPHGRPDLDGLPPFLADVHVELPPGAVCRWVNAPGEGVSS